MWLKGLIRDDAEIIVVPEAKRFHAHDNVLPDEDHDWIFAIGLRLDDLNFFCRCSIRLGADSTELRVADRPKPFSITPDEPATYAPAVQALYEHLRKWLRCRSSSGNPEPKMGFDLQKP